ncbi:glycosyltransferase family 2 protein [Spartinivicinus ruber]|uniref:glycosyltransferase family 2 protein n=1 Tax=Spartinivicinus ruber TaxID=2683272 RepID=UPI0013D59C76|nr:glycosyltransferase family 2 protein [Spartinivicinus ruber]
MSEFKPCIVIPIYNHSETISDVIVGINTLNLPCIVVDDGSNDITKQVLKKLEQDNPQLRLETLAKNQGKGAAVKQGLAVAWLNGFSHALQVDADGQHDLQDIPQLLAKAKQNPEALVTGQPLYDESIPKSRQYGRLFTHFWVWLETLSFTDSMIGFRVYPLASAVSVLDQVVGERMDFDIEVLVKMIWQGIPVQAYPTRVIYPENGISHFNLWHDNWLISKMHTRLMCGMVFRLPSLLKRKLFTQQATHWAMISERGSIWGLKFLLWVFRLGGDKLVRPLLYPIIGYFYLTNKTAQQASKTYLSRVAKQQIQFNQVTQLLSEYIRPDVLVSSHDSFKHFMAFGKATLDKCAVWANKITEKDVDIVNNELFDSLLVEQQGAMLITAHFGNSEICRALAYAKYGQKVNVLVHTKHAVAFNKIIQEINPEAQLSLIEVTEIGPDTAIMLSEKIEQGEFIVIVGDRTSVNDPANCCYVDFLGHLAPFPKGPFILAGLLKCPVYLLLCYQEQNRYRVHFEKITEQIPFGKKVRDQEILNTAKIYVNYLERFCLKQPLQWFNFFDFWQQDKVVNQQNPAVKKAVK